MIIKNKFFLKIYDYYINYIASNTINKNSKNYHGAIDKKDASKIKNKSINKK